MTTISVGRSRNRFQDLRWSTVAAVVARRLDPRNALPWGLFLLAISVIACFHIIPAGQYQTADLTPIGDAHDMFGVCLLPYQDAGLGRANPVPVPGLCLSGAISVLIGAANAQHLFLIGCIAGAGLSMLWLLRRLGNPPLLACAGALLYEFSPAVLGQFAEGGPGILLAAAVLPAVIAAAVAPRTARPVVEGARAAALLSVITLFNPQAPLMAIVFVVPFLFAALARNGKAWTWRLAVSFLITLGLCALPVLLMAGGQGALLAARTGDLPAEIQAGIGSTPPMHFAIPYAWIGLAPAALGGLFALSSRDAHPGEQAALAAALCTLVLYLLMHTMGMSVVRVFGPMVLFKDVIKLQVLLGISIVVLGVAGLRWIVIRVRSIRPFFWRATAIGLGVAIAGVPIVATQAPVLASGDLGIGVHALPRTVADALADLRHRAPDASSYRVLWLPQDLRTVGELSTLLPSALMYRGDATPAAQQLVLDTFDAFAQRKAAAIAPMLSEAGVRYVVLQTEYTVQAGAPFEQGDPVVAAIGGTKVLAGAPDRFAALLAGAPSISRVTAGAGFSLYVNELWRPLMSMYKAAMVADVAGVPATVSGDSPVTLQWTASRDLSWTQEGQDVRIPARAQTSRVPVIAVVPVVPGNTYELAGTIEAHDAGATQIKVAWPGLNTLSMSPVKALSRSTATESFRVMFQAPAHAQHAQLELFGGWSDGRPGYSLFRDMTMRAVRPSPSLIGVGQRPIALSVLRRQLSGLLVETGTAPGEATQLGVSRVLTMKEGQCTADLSQCALLLGPAELQLNGDWALAVAMETDAPLRWFTANARDSQIVVPATALRGAPGGSTVSWLEFPDADVTQLNPIVHRDPVLAAREAVTLRCQHTGCAIGNIIVLPPLPATAALTRVLMAPNAAQVGEPGNLRPVSLAGDWASVYPGTLAALPSSAQDPTTRLRVFALATAFVSLLVALAVLPRWRLRRWKGSQ